MFCENKWRPPPKERRTVSYDVRITKESLVFKSLYSFGGSGDRPTQGRRLKTKSSRPRPRPLTYRLFWGPNDSTTGPLTWNLKRPNFSLVSPLRTFVLPLPPVLGPLSRHLSTTRTLRHLCFPTEVSIRYLSYQNFYEVRQSNLVLYTLASSDVLFFFHGLFKFSLSIQCMVREIFYCWLCISNVPFW